MEKFAAFLTSRRKELKLSQSELGEILGYSMQTVSNWETGRCLPDLALWDKLAKALEIDVTGLLTCEVRNFDCLDKERNFDVDAFRKNLKELRVEQGLTQIDLASITHTNNKTVSFWESGTSSPSMENFFALKTLFGVTIRSLYYGFKEKDEFIPNVKVEETKEEKITPKPKHQRSVARDVLRYTLFSSIVLGGIFYVAMGERDRVNFYVEPVVNQKADTEVDQIKFKAPVIENKFEAVIDNDKKELSEQNIEKKKDEEMKKPGMPSITYTNK